MATVEQVVKHLLSRIDELEKRIEALEAGAPATDEWNAEIDVDLTSKPTDDTDLDDLDPGERDQVLAARRRLTEDAGKEIESVLEPTQVSLDVGLDGVTAWFPVPTDEQINQRQALLDQVGLEELVGIETDDAIRGWIQGGPLWLHAYDRDHVLSLPVPVRQAFVLDAMISSNRDAQELGRDILKDESPGTPDITLEAIGG